MIKVNSNIAEMSKYQPPWDNLDRLQYLRLDLNENTLSPPQKVVKALRNYITAKKIQIYPDYGKFMPRLAQYAKVKVENLICTNGSDQAIEVILRTFLNRDNSLLLAQPGFPMFDQIAGVIGCEVQGVNYDQNLNFPFDKFLETVSARTALIVVINPNNPTGTPVSLDQIKTILETHPNLPVLVDEAYYEFTRTTALEFLEEHPNLIITRTFSKAFAMAGLRLGYIIAHPDIITEFYKVRGPFDVNSCAIVAAESQLASPGAWKRYVHETMTVAKPYLEEFFNQNRVVYYPGAANFMLVQPGDRDAAVEYLKRNKVLVRPMSASQIKDTFRMNIGNLWQTKRFIKVYSRFLDEVEKNSA